MATDDCQISADPNTDSSRQENEEPNILLALRGTEGSNNLRRGSLPVKIFSHNPVDTMDTAPRSSNADGAWSQDKPISLNLWRETKTAFEDLPVFPGKIGQNGENSEGKSSRRPNDANPSITEHASEEIQNAVDSSSTRDKKIRFAGPLFQARTLANKTLYAASGGEPENSLCYNLTSRRQAKSTKNSKHVQSLGQPSTTKGISKREDERKKVNQDESNDDLSTKLQQTADGKTEEATDNINEVEDDDTTAEGRERSDTIKSLLEFPFLPLQTDSRRKSSPASLRPRSAPAHQTGASRQGNPSLGGVHKFPSTSGQSEAPSTPGSSNEAARIPSSQSRTTSITPSVAGSSETEKGSMGLTTLASSLVRWKIKRARAKKRVLESIAKDAKHQEFMDRTADRIKTELPRSLLISIQEEACPIVQRTAQAYRSQLGAKHKLTVQASERLANLMRDLTNPY